MRRAVVVVVTAAVVVLRSFHHVASAADARYPDWPCAQVKVPELSVSAMWAGPSLDDVVDKWEADPTIRELVARLAERRMPVEEAESTIGEFVSGAAPEKEVKAKQLFAGLFDTLNRQRSEVMSAIERFSRRQKDLAAKVRAEVLALRELQDRPDTDPAKLDQAANEIAWNTRIFEERRGTIGFVCEVPVTIERRLFALARAIQQTLD
jgi:hypothetical protein